VSTFERLDHRRKGNKLFLSHIDTLVIDEFDTLVDSGKSDAIRFLLEGYLRTDDTRQVVFASATVTKQMRELVKEFFGDKPKFKEIIEKSTHMNLAHLKHEFIHIADFDKIKSLQLLVKEYQKHAKKHDTAAIVFCNSVASARAIEHALSEKGIRTASMHGDIPPKMRERNFERFKRHRKYTS